jgi:hypothetical protein
LQTDDHLLQTDDHYDEAKPQLEYNIHKFMAWG